MLYRVVGTIDKKGPGINPSQGRGHLIIDKSDVAFASSSVVVRQESVR